MSEQIESEKPKSVPKLTASIDYIFDENTQESEELAALIKPVRKRFKYTIYYNALLLLGFYKYGQNVNFWVKKYFKRRLRGVMGIILFSTLHSLVFCGLLIGGNCLVLGINPIKFQRKYKEITDRIIEKEGLDVESLSDIFSAPIKKIEDSKVGGKTFKDEIRSRKSNINEVQQDNNKL